LFARFPAKFLLGEIYLTMKFPFSLERDRQFDVVGFGTNAVDYLIEVPEYPTFNSKVELNRYTQAAGGEVATTMVGLNRLGLATSYVGRFGSDAEGEFGLSSLTTEGVNVEHASKVPGAATQIAFIVIDARNGERTVIWKRDAALKYTAAEAPLGLVQRASVLHLTPHDIEASIALAREARSSSTIVSVDIDNVFDGLEELLPLVDMLIASAEFPAKLFGCSIDHHDALREMSARYGCRLCGVTLGAAGSLIYSSGEYIESAGFAVPGVCRDTTGAGDAYRVGLLYGLLTGRSVEEAARCANAVAALKCREVGARTALPTERELLQFLEA
jgi:sugar/nucleoside kinase (ribokinase family)